VDYDPTEDLAKYHYGQVRTFELFLPLVLLATLAMLAEGWLANPIRAKSGSAEEIENRKSKIEIPRRMQVERETG
jgi:HAMP domain-containing protein